MLISSRSWLFHGSMSTEATFKDPFFIERSKMRQKEYIMQLVCVCYSWVKRHVVSCLFKVNKTNTKQSVSSTGIKLKDFNVSQLLLTRINISRTLKIKRSLIPELLSQKKRDSVFHLLYWVCLAVQFLFHTKIKTHL